VRVKLEPWERPPRNRSIGRLEALAYDRHRRDRETGHKRGLHFDAAAAERAIRFMALCPHQKGEWAGQPFRPAQWQEFCTRSLFGWLTEEERRRFHFGYVDIASKNGKTTWIAPLGLYLLTGDREPGAEVYSAATVFKQARLGFDVAAWMAKHSALSQFLEVFGGKPQSRTNVIACDLLAAKFEPIAADADTADGINPHGLLIDELHRWKKREFYDVLMRKMGARRQPLALQITTAGAGQEGLCWDIREYCRQLLEGSFEDDRYFAFIASPDPDADWTAEETWEQGNPSIDIAVDREDLRREAAQALVLPSAQNSFRRFKCNQWTEQVERWLPMEPHWKDMGGGIDEELLRGRPCFGGIDLSSTTDITSCCWWFPPLPEDEHDHHLLLWRSWLPEERVLRGSREDRVPYEQWKAKGWIETTPGDVVDYEWIEAKILEDAAKFDIQEIGFDPWNAQALVNRLQEIHGFTMVKIVQGVSGMSAPSKEFERLWLRKALRHGDNLLARYSCSVVATWTDPNQNIKPSRKSSGGRIDLVVAAIVALARAMLTFESGSVYETRGLG